MFAYHFIESCGWPAVGGIAEQSAAFMHAVAILESERTACERENKRNS